ncbi:MBL fold metallo-hydrolase [Brevibacterium yomogidense]|uniref:MBL fold metallo-hydrolase n=1 Tax=Brevibacterium yomogidense TaxID=946573 RepID=UPI0018DFB3ED|nr:MBL fold metallo-hydrolase [Brevibacterium yomogidense]
MSDLGRLPAGVRFEERLFPHANLLVLPGEQAAVVDSGFASQVDVTQSLVDQHTRRVDWVFNTHWHSDHVGGNQRFQSAGAGIIGSATDSHDLAQASPGCCAAEYLDQPVPAYAIDRTASDGDVLHLGDHAWHVLEVPGHTPGHLALWDPESRSLVVGDTLSAYDVGWVDVMREGTEGLDAAIASVSRLGGLDAGTIVPGHGPLIADTAPAIDKALDRLRRQRADLPFAVDYGAKRILAFQLMIRGGMAADGIEDYVAGRRWAQAAAEVVGTDPHTFATALVRSMVDGGGAQVQHGRVRAATPAEEADPSVFDLPWPREWHASR